VKDSNRLIWLDLEMTGLGPETSVIMEIGCVVTDSDLNVVAEGESIAIHLSDNELNAMDDWCTEHHGKSGLTDRCRHSRISLEEAEEKTLKWLQQHCEAGKSPLCGNSIGQDRRFLYKYMPVLNEFFHYRNIDVSSIKELSRRWYPNVRPPEKRKTHTVMEDIRESIEELRHYRKAIFR